ncbi:MAG TPA: DUF2835 family protein [Candidatus Tenderia electrophaga]|uniref:DUF2835 family protein n=1 Tax=Candidatus Tenderia electrophaga TaxID=1748243 RepID=A0A832J5T6_9GAMM|nr:DUF2835 family protein [Candidatus Tenderia electrophaga]
MPQQKIHFVLQISAHQYMEYYSGAVRDVVTVARDGRTLRFPANLLRPFVAQDGIQGEFVIEFDDNNKFVAINRL